MTDSQEEWNPPSDFPLHKETKTDACRNYGRRLAVKTFMNFPSYGCGNSAESFFQPIVIHFSEGSERQFFEKYIAFGLRPLIQMNGSGGPNPG